MLRFAVIGFGLRISGMIDTLLKADPAALKHPFGVFDGTQTPPLTHATRPADGSLAGRLRFCKHRRRSPNGETTYAKQPRIAHHRDGLALDRQR